MWINIIAADLLFSIYYVLKDLKVPAFDGNVEVSCCCSSIVPSHLTQAIKSKPQSSFSGQTYLHPSIQTHASNNRQQFSNTRMFLSKIMLLGYVSVFPDIAFRRM
jgi:hypothetical protein